MWKVSHNAESLTWTVGVKVLGWCELVWKGQGCEVAGKRVRESAGGRGRMPEIAGECENSCDFARAQCDPQCTLGAKLTGLSATSLN